jgi:S1-C subfamily serine protease
MSLSYAAGSVHHHAIGRGQALTTEEIAKLALPSVVSITVVGKDGKIAKEGSGFVVGDNLIVTNFHVVRGTHTMTANFQNGRSETVYGVVNYDTDHDLALIYVNTHGVKPLPLQTSISVPIGEPVVAVGSPEGLGGSISTGVVSALRTSSNMKIIQTTAAISPGSSGGALIDPQGRVLGVTSFFVEGGQNLNFAYSAYYIKALLPKGMPVYLSWDTMADKFKDDWTTEEPTGSDSGANNPLPSPSGPPATADSGVTDKPLAGLHSFYLVLENLQDNATAAGLSGNDIQNDVEQKLHQASLPLIDENDSSVTKKDPTGAYLYINVNTIKNDDGVFAYNISITLYEMVRLQRGASDQVEGGTWHTGGIGVVGSDNLASAVRDDVKSYLDDFVKDYTAQNP